MGKSISDHNVTISLFFGEIDFIEKKLNSIFQNMGGASEVEHGPWYICWVIY